MPYDLYARPVYKTAFYDTMRLYRQEVFADWIAPFEAMRRDLKQEEVPHANVG